MKDWQRRVIGNACKDDRGPIAPTWSSQGEPLCPDEDCSYYDGKRCELLGMRPSRHCEPAIVSMAELLSKARPA